MKTKALISLAETSKLTCVFVFAYAKSLFSHDEVHMESKQKECEKVFISLKDQLKKPVTWHRKYHYHTCFLDAR